MLRYEMCYHIICIIVHKEKPSKFQTDLDNSVVFLNIKTIFGVSPFNQLHDFLTFPFVKVFVSLNGSAHHERS
jgi:hypothetical protein